LATAGISGPASRIRFVTQARREDPIVTPRTTVHRMCTALGAAVLAMMLAACGGTVSGSATGADVARSIESLVSDAAKAARVHRCNTSLLLVDLNGSGSFWSFYVK